MTIKEVDKTHDHVYFILKTYMAARNSDKFLIAAYMNRYHNITTLKEVYTQDCPAFETITRCRRKIQADGEFLSDKQIAAHRKKREQEFIGYALDKDLEQSQLF